jgi:sporulation protein YlmC with PRC-barrel domain
MERIHPGEKAWDPHLRSTHDVSGYHIQATDGEIGHVEDFIIDDETWAIRYLIIDTHELVAGKKGAGFAAMDRAR